MTHSPPNITLVQRIAYLPFAFSIWALGKLPFHWRSAFGGWLLRGPIGGMIGYRKRVESNLNLIFPDMPEMEKKKIANQSLSNAGRTFIENFYHTDFVKSAGPFKIHGEGIAALDEAVASGRPVQLISGHFGNHEAMRKVLYDRGIKVGGLYRPMSIKAFNEFYEKTLDIDGKTGPQFKIGREGTRAYRQCLKDGNVVLVLLIDVSTPKGEKFNFLNQPAFTSTASASFALDADALYLPYFSMRCKNGFNVEIGAPIPHSDNLTMVKLASIELEKRILADPGNWFWVHKRWKDYDK